MRIAVAGGTGVVGREVVGQLAAAGHEAQLLARSVGVDLVAGTGVDLAGVDAVVDVSGPATTSARKATAFFEATTRTLLAADVPHLVVLSIVGIDRAPGGYYAGKLAQERLVAAGRTPWTLLRATQFHDFAGQVWERSPGPIVPAMRTQPVAAAEVAARLVQVATGAPQGRVRDLGGPEPFDLVDLVRRTLAADGRTPRLLTVPLPGAMGRAMRRGGLLPGPDADLGTVTFEDWLATRTRPR